MCDVYGLFFCTSAEISGMKYYLLKRSVSDEINIISILHDKSSSIFSPPRVHMQIFFNKPTQKILHYFQDNSHIRGCMCGVWGWDIYFQVFADVTKGRYHQTLLLPLTPHDLWLTEMHHKNYLFYHSNYFWFKHGKTLA